MKDFLNSLKLLAPLFTVGIFLISFLALLLAGFSSMLNAKIDPMKKDMARIEQNQARFEQTQARFEQTQIRFNEELKEIKSTLNDIKKAVLSK